MSEAGPARCDDLGTCDGTRRHSLRSCWLSKSCGCLRTSLHEDAFMLSSFSGTRAPTWCRVCTLSRCKEPASAACESRRLFSTRPSTKKLLSPQSWASRCSTLRRSADPCHRSDSGSSSSGGSTVGTASVTASSRLQTSSSLSCDPWSEQRKPEACGVASEHTSNAISTSVK